MGRPRLYTDEERKEKRKAYSKKYEKKRYDADPGAAKAKAKKWYWENHERARANNIAWTKANPENIKAKEVTRWKEKSEELKKKCNEWRKANPGRTREQHAIWWKKNAARMRTLNAAWKKAHPEEMRTYNHNRRALVTGNGGKLSPGLEAKLLAFQKNRCAVCRASLKKTGHHLDHIVPLAKGGKNTDSNIQITCKKCNREKHSKDPIQFMREKGFLL